MIQIQFNLQKYRKKGLATQFLAVGKCLLGHCYKEICRFTPYGYKKDPNDKHKWLIDEEAASVVSSIFQMTMDGKGPNQIARILTEEKIEKPSYYLATKRKNSDKPSTRDLSDPYQWHDTSIVAMLKKPEYCGQAVR